MKLYSINTGNFKLDGGAMFGVVPKTMWNKINPADENNLCAWSMRCLLVEDEGRLILIDNGIGNKQDAKFFGHYYLHGDDSLDKSLAAAGFSRSDITDVFLTHLHFDHCGGTTSYNASNELTENFPNATYHVHEKHWETALHPNAREKASFYKENIDPIMLSGRLNLTYDSYQFEENLTIRVVNGHTSGQQLRVLTSGDKTLIFIADLIPTFAHIPLPWIMGYDMQPLVTLEEKESLLSEAVENQYYLFMQHDADHEVVTVKNINGKYQADQFLLLNDISD